MAGYPAYIYQNLVEALSTSTSSTQDSAYPRTNLKDRIAAKPFKWTSGTTPYVEIDFGSAVAFDTVALINHNIPYFTAGSQVLGGTSSPANILLSAIYHTPENIWVDTGPHNYRFVRIAFETLSAVPSLGELVIGARQRLPRSPRWGISPGIVNSGVTHRSYGGVTWDYEFSESRFLRPTFRFPKSEYADFELFSRRVRRNPFVWIPNDDTTGAITVEVDMHVNSAGNAELFLNPGVTSAVNVSVTANVRKTYLFSGFTGDPEGHVPNFRFDPIGVNGAIFKIYSIKVFAGDREIRRWSSSEIAAWPTRSNIGSEIIAADYYQGTASTNDPILQPGTGLGESSNVFYVKKSRGFEPNPIGGFRDRSIINDWYDWTVPLDAESAGLAVNA